MGTGRNLIFNTTIYLPNQTTISRSLFFGLRGNSAGIWVSFSKKSQQSFLLTSKFRRHESWKCKDSLLTLTRSTCRMMMTSMTCKLLDYELKKFSTSFCLVFTKSGVIEAHL